MRLMPGPSGELRWFAKQTSKWPPLSKEQEFELARRSRQGDQEARDLLILHNLRFAFNRIVPYRDKGITQGDLLSASLEGLIWAADRFDERKGFRFVTYAVHWIKKKIISALQDSQTIYLPDRRTAQLLKAQSIFMLLEQKLGRRPHPDEVSELSEIPVDVLNDLTQLSVVSYDKTFHGNDDWVEYIEDPKDLIQSVEDKTSSEFISSMMEQYLTPRQQQVLSLYFGLDGEEPVTLQAAGQSLGISRERARQIKEEALELLRQCPQLRQAI